MSAPVGLRRPPGVLGEILDRTVAELPGLVAGPPAPGPRRDFVGALRAPGLSLIAEVKPRSPSAGALRPALDVAAVCAAYAPHAQAVSVLVDGPHFGGSFALLAQVRARVPCPVLAKGFFVDERQIDAAAAAGADAVLLMAALLAPARLGALRAHARSRGLAALVEAHDATELAEVVASGATVVGVNSRDLATLRIDRARGRALLATVPDDRVRVAESGLHSKADVDAVRGLADAVLIGSAFMAAPDIAARIVAMGLGR